MLTYFVPFDRTLSRRALLFSSCALGACARHKGRGFPGFALVGNAGSRTISAVDLNTFVTARQIGLGGVPGAVIAHPRRPVAYVLIPESGTVCEIDATKLNVTRRARTGGAALALLADPGGESLWVLQARSLIRLDCEHLRVAQTIRLPEDASGLDIHSNGLAALGCAAARRVVLVRLQSGRIEHAMDASCQPSFVRFQADGKQVMAGSRADRCLMIFDTASGRTAVRLPLPVEPVNCCFDAAGGQMFLTGAGMDAVVIIYPYQTEIGETILAGRAPDGMAVSATPSYLFVANPEAGRITVLDIDTRKLVASIPVGQEPRRILITPDNQYALVLNQRSGNMAVIRISSFTARRHRTDPPPLFTVVPLGVQPVGGAIVEVAT